MKRLIVLGLTCALAACQSDTAANIGKMTGLKKPEQVDAAPLRPTGSAFNAASSSKVTDFASCAAVGIVIAVTTPAQCVHDGVTFTNG